MHSHHNGLKTAALLGLLSGLILAVGYWLGGSGGLIFAVFISLAMNAGTYFFSDKLALRAMRAQPVTEAQFPALHQIVRELAMSAGIATLFSTHPPMEQRVARLRQMAGAVQLRR